MPADSTSPQVGDAVVFFPPGTITATGYADHVGLVTAVNADGTVNLVNGDFMGTSNSTVQYNTNINLSTWASQVWSPGEQWVFVAPPGTAQQPVPHATVSGPRVAVAGTAADFTARASAKRWASTVPPGKRWCLLAPVRGSAGLRWPGQRPVPRSL
jgi:hypothetical protein